MKTNSTTAVPVVKKTVFALKTRAALAPKGRSNINFVEAVNEQCGEAGKEFNRIHLVSEVTDGNGNRFRIPKDYNIYNNERGLNAFISDYNAWSPQKLTDDDMYKEFDAEAMIKGKSAVVEIGHRKDGKKWEAYIMAFHPAADREAVAA